MSDPKISDRERELEEFEDALVASILEGNDAEVYEAIAVAGENPATIVQQFDAMLVAARTACGLQRLSFARLEMEQFAATSKPLDEADRDSARSCFANARLNVSHAPERYLLAARKGQGASQRDLESMVDDYAELERLERDSGAKK